MALAQLAGAGIASTALTAVLGSGVVALAVLLAAGRPWRGRGAALAPWGAPLALAGAFATGYALALGAPGFPPASARGWLFFGAVAGAALGLLMARTERPLRPLSAAASALLPWFLLGFQREHHWGHAEGIAWTAGLAVLALLAVEALRAAEARAQGPASAFGVAFGLALAAGAQGLAGSASFAQLTGILALATGLCALAGTWHRAAGLGAAAAPALVLPHLGLVWCGRYLAELHASSFVLLSLLPMAPLAVLVLPGSRPRLRASLAIALPVAMGAIALWIEVAGAPPPSPYG